MRRKVELYIGGLLADLSSQDLILLNWTQEDAANPTAVVAPYSQQVTLPGTPANDAIFGAIWRPDRRTALTGGWTGAAFDPLRKTPFVIYSDTGEIIESGYVRLDSVDRKGPRVSYKVTLFGSIGSVFYSLTYRQDGETMSLADLDYIGGGESELDFDITAQAVLAAWDDLGVGDDPLWSVVNFAPAYEGIPDKDFDATKAVATPGNVNLDPEQHKDQETYKDKGGRCLVNLPSAMDEWAVKDLRSYLQRPVINLGKVFDGIVAKAAEAGYTLDLSAINSLGKYAPSRLWLTLPLLSALAPSTVTGATLTKSAPASPSNPIATWTIGGTTIPSGTKVNVSVNTILKATLSSTTPAPSMFQEIGSTVNLAADEAVFFVRLAGYASGTEVASSKILCINNRFEASRGLSAFSAFALLSDTSGYSEGDFVSSPQHGEVIVQDATSALISPEIILTVEGFDIDEVRLEVVASGIIRAFFRPGTYETEFRAFNPVTTGGIVFLTGVRPTWLTPLVEASSAVTSLAGSSADGVTFSVGGYVRSGAHITKRMLLGSTKTPAEYLLSYAKALGLYFVTNSATKTVTLMTRGQFYSGGTEDLTGRVDVSSISIRPVAVDSKWYRFADDPKGEFADEYQKTYGAPYGSQKIDTGYAFNDSVKDLAGGVLKGAVTALERTPWFNFAEDLDGAFIPSQFLYAGCTYTLWTAGGKSADFEIQAPAPVDVNVFPYNSDPDLEGYDQEFANKIQLHTADGKAVDGADILLFLEGENTYDYFKVSDDDAAMYAITGGKGCWNLDPGPGVSVPSFQRYTWRSGNYHVDASLDYGEPRELAFPRQIYSDGNDRTIYGRCWRAYMRDRFGGDTKVMTCKVDLSGMMVGAALLRRFWWYDGAIWVINKISNYSVTTPGPVSCEFVQVIDPDAYVDGQKFD